MEHRALRISCLMLWKELTARRCWHEAQIDHSFAKQDTRSSFLLSRARMQRLVLSRRGKREIRGKGDLTPTT